MLRELDSILQCFQLRSCCGSSSELMIITVLITIIIVDVVVVTECIIAIVSWGFGGAMEKIGPPRRLDLSGEVG